MRNLEDSRKPAKSLVYYSGDDILRGRGKLEDYITNKNPSITIDKSKLNRLRDLGSSAHVVTMYEHVDAGDHTLYFGKSIGKDESKWEAIAEVMYSLIWRHFIGERASQSLLIIDQGKIIGICSRGLSGFIEYRKLLNRNSGFDIDQPGLISIMALAYLLLEDDLHINNIGLFNFCLPGESKSVAVFGKIDNDYIIDKFYNKSQHFTNHFSVETLYDFLKTGNVNYFKSMMSSLRFSPGTNNKLLNFPHAVRGLAGGANTTLGKKNSDLFYSKYLTKHRDEMNFVKKSIEDFSGIDHILDSVLKEAERFNIAKKERGFIRDIASFIVGKIKLTQNYLNR